MSAIPIRLFQQYFEAVALPPEWTLTLLDGNGDVIARRSPPERKDLGAGEGDARRFTEKSSASIWSLVIEVPPDVYRAPIVAAALALVFAILLHPRQRLRGTAGRQAVDARRGGAGGNISNPFRSRR